MTVARTTKDKDDQNGNAQYNVDFEEGEEDEDEQPGETSLTKTLWTFFTT